MKKFFYACAAILCLVLAYHFGATNAHGQGSSLLRYVGSTDQSTVWYATDNGIWTITETGWKSPSQVGSPEPPVPASQVVAYNNKRVVTTAGEGFYESGGSWVSVGLIPGGPTPVTSQSFGQLKAKYR